MRFNELTKQSVEESGLQYSIGVKKHGKEYMTKAAQLARDGASQEELGALKDRLSKAHKGKAKNEGVGEASKPDAYRRDEINATSGFGKDSQAYQADGGANDEDHESNRRREQQVQSGTWYIRLNGKLIRDKQGNPYSFRGKAAANKAALTMQAKLFNQGKEFMLTTNPNDKQQGTE